MRWIILMGLWVGVGLGAPILTWAAFRRNAPLSPHLRRRRWLIVLAVEMFAIMQVAGDINLGRLFAIPGEALIWVVGGCGGIYLLTMLALLDNLFPFVGILPPWCRKLLFPARHDGDEDG